MKHLSLVCHVAETLIWSFYPFVTFEEGNLKRATQNSEDDFALDLYTFEMTF